MAVTTAPDQEHRDEMLSSIYNTVPCGILRFNRKDGVYRLLSINPAAMRLLGYTPENAFSADWSNGVAGTILPINTWPILDAYNQLKQVGDTARIDYYCAALPDGSIRFLTGEVVLLAEDENGQLIQRLLYDITDRVRLEEQLRQEQMQYRDALLHDCKQAYTFDVNEGIIYSLQKSETTHSVSTVNLPAHYDTMIRNLAKNSDAVVLSGSLEEHCTEGYLNAYRQGRRVLELEFYVPSKDLYQRKTTFLSRDSITGHVLACVVTREVPELRKKELATQRALAELAETAEQIMHGNLDVQFNTTTGGDVGALAQVFQRTVAELKSRIEHINELANTDPLSSMRNKRAYDKAVEDLDTALRQTPDIAFGVVMFDLNNLKWVNDNFGHQLGDQYIRIAAKQIRDAFSEVTVYRIGGDEFVAILDAYVLDQMERLVAEMQQVIAQYNASHSELPYDVSIAIGCTAYNKETDRCYADVYHRADMKMYEDKKRRKKS